MTLKKARLGIYTSVSASCLPLFMNNANRVKGIEAIAAIMNVTWIDVGSYDALKSGRKGIGNNTQIHRPDTIINNFHRFFTLCFKNEYDKPYLLKVQKNPLIAVT